MPWDQIFSILPLYSTTKIKVDYNMPENELLCAIFQNADEPTTVCETTSLIHSPAMHRWFRDHLREL